MPQLDKYLVTLGVQGQNIVLATMDKIRKKGGDLSKKKQVVKMTAARGATGGATEPIAGKKAVPSEEKSRATTDKFSTGAGKKAVPSEEKSRATTDKFSTGVKTFDQSATDLNRREEQSGKKFSKAADNLKDGAKNFASAASTLDPVSTVSSVTSAIGTSLSGISVLGVSLGRLPEGIAHIANSTLSMAKNSVDMAKQATAAFYQLTTRNAAAEHYGKDISTGPMSRNERAMFIDAVSGSMGRIQQPLADELNKLVGKKDTRSLARVGAGDWESTGTDKGWMLGQLSSSFQGLPPSIKQKLQASLLKNNSDEIQNMAPGQVGAQKNAATWANMEEDQTARLAAKAPQAIGLAANLNSMQVTLYDTGLKFAGTVNTTISTLNDLANTIPRVKAALNDLVASPNLTNVRRAVSAFSGETPRAGK